jgi:thiamine-monophosphate kinase
VSPAEPAGKTPARGGEEAFVAWLRKKLPRPVRVGDDTAELAARGRLVITVDQQIEGTHFARGLDLFVLGRRLMAVNLSDLAASGARPRWAVLALGLPEECDPRRLVEGVLAEAKRHGVALVGGDVAHSPLLTSSLTLLGDKDPKAASLARDQARAGHALWLGGPVGESALGCELFLRGAQLRGSAVTLPKDKGVQLRGNLSAAGRRAVARHLVPPPQLGLGRWLASLGSSARSGAGAVIDVSDGLAKDLRRLCVASGVGAELDLRRLRAAVSPRFAELAAALGLDPIALALGGGEDYVLLFTLPAGVEPPSRFGCAQIGRITRAKEIWLLDAAGQRLELPEIGWDHLS